MSNTQNLKGKKIAILATNGFEQSELIQPRDKFIEQGADVDVLSIDEGNSIFVGTQHIGIDLTAR